MYSNWGPSMQVFIPYVFMGGVYNPATYMGSGLDNPPPEYVKAWELENYALSQKDPDSFAQGIKDFLIYTATETVQEIAVTSSFPIPMIVHNRMGNVPKTGISLKGEATAHPEQFYIKY